MHLAGAVAGQHRQRRRRRGDPAEFRDRDRGVGEHLQQERLELVVGAVDLVDEQHARAGLQRLQQRPGDQEPPVVQARLDLVGSSRSPARLDRAQVQDLARKVPVVERLRRVEALVALQPDERRSGRVGQGLRERGLADARVAFQEQRPAQPHRQEAGRGEAVVGQVAGLGERPGQRLRRVDVIGADDCPMTKLCRRRSRKRQYSDVDAPAAPVTSDRGGRGSRCPFRRRCRHRRSAAVRPRAPRRYGLAPVSPTAAAATPAQWSRPISTGWPCRPRVRRGEQCARRRPVAGRAGDPRDRGRRDARRVHEQDERGVDAASRRRLGRVRPGRRAATSPSRSPTPDSRRRPRPPRPPPSRTSSAAAPMTAMIGSAPPVRSVSERALPDINRPPTRASAFGMP